MKDIKTLLVLLAGVVAGLVLAPFDLPAQVDSDLPDLTGIDEGTCISIDDGETSTPEVNLNFTCSDARIATWALRLDPSGTVPLDRLPIWTGTQAEYDALSSINPDFIYLVLE